MHLQRLPDWPQRLAVLIATAARRPFAWGVWDCCLWGADGVRAVTGFDPAAPWRESYGTREAALRLLRELGGLQGLPAMVGPEIQPGRAIDGDVGLVHDGRRGMLAVHGGQHWLVVGAQGLGSVPLGRAVRAWGVGHD